jgi:hypothetical protein
MIARNGPHLFAYDLDSTLGPSSMGVPLVVIFLPILRF